MSPPSVLWHGMQAERQITPDGILPYAMLRDHQFALVAAEQIAELPDGLKGVLLVTRGFEGSADLMPCLLELAKLTRDQFAWLMQSLDDAHEQASQPVICALLRSAASSARIVAHWREHQSRSWGDARAWLRLHDPYVFVQLPRVLGEAAWRSVMKPMETWSIPLAGQWHTCTVLPAEANAPRAPRSRKAMEAQWNALLRIGAVNRALFQRGWTTFSEIVEHSGHLDDLVLRANQRHGLRRPNEQAAFAALGADCRLEFDEHPDITQALIQQQGEQERGDPQERMETNVLDTLQALPPDIWARVRQDCARHAA